MLVAHVNRRCIETCVNIKLPFFLHVLISLKKNIIQYCGTWYGFDCGGFAAMFADPTYLHIYDNEYDDKRSMKITLKNHGLLICVSL
jgi:hypothetical protein